MYLFSKRIKCLNCDGNFKGIKERNKEKYICSTYTNYRTCVRHVVDQRSIIYLVANHLEIDMVKSGMGLQRDKKRKVPETFDPITIEQVSRCVKQITIDPMNKTTEILYNDNTRTFVSDQKIQY